MQILGEITYDQFIPESNRHYLKSPGVIQEIPDSIFKSNMEENKTTLEK
jgi:hypothetical protein